MQIPVIDNITGIFVCGSVCVLRCRHCENLAISCAWLAGFSREFHCFQKLVIPVYLVGKRV